MSERNKLTYNIDWVIPSLRNPSKLWNIAASITIACVGLFSKIIIRKVNITKENMRLKWGIGRMIYESPVTPIVIPIWHVGMDDVLPNVSPYMVRMGKNLTFNYGKPLDFTELIAQLKDRKASDMEARKEITDCIQKALWKLKEETELLHHQYYNLNS